MMKLSKKPYSSDFFYCSEPDFDSWAVYCGVKKMVEAYPEADEEIIRRRWLGLIYSKVTFPPLELKECGLPIGKGVFALNTIKAETVVGEYTGLVKRRKLFSSSRKNYVGEYTISGYPVKYIIDAEGQGSLMRFVNHSERANLYSITVIASGILRIYFVAQDDIETGNQLLIDYGPNYWRWRSKPLNISFT